jgi:hypothetical protein
MTNKKSDDFEWQRDATAEEYENIVAPEDSWGRTYIAYKAGADWARDFIESQRGTKDLFTEIAKLQARVKELEGELEFYATGAHVKRETIRGRVIEYDVDAGPLYEHYEEYIHNEFPPGKRARQALASLGEKGDDCE